MDTLSRYRANRFTDADIVRCTGLPVRGLRELIRFGAVNTIAERRGPGRGRIRVCDAVVFKRIAVISVLNNAGLSVAVSGQIAFAFPYHTLLFTVCDPLTILFEHSVHIEPETGLPPRRERPATDWFNPDQPAKPDPDSDWLVEIYDGRFVGCSYGAKTAGSPVIFGDLRHERATFVAWQPSHHRTQVNGSPIAQLAEELLPYHRFVDFVAAWEDPEKSRRGRALLGYADETHRVTDDPLRLLAEATAQNFAFKTTVNVSLAIKKALRRYLELDPALVQDKSENQDA